MFGETSLLKSGVATASIVCDGSEATLLCIEGSFLESLFTSQPQLPGRFFAFLAQYQARRLSDLTKLMSKDKHEVAGQNFANVSINDIFSNPVRRRATRRAIRRTSAQFCVQFDAQFSEPPRPTLARRTWASSAST